MAGFHPLPDFIPDNPFWSVSSISRQGDISRRICKSWLTNSFQEPERQIVGSYAAFSLEGIDESDDPSSDVEVFTFCRQFLVQFRQAFEDKLYRRCEGALYRLQVDSVAQCFAS